MEKKPQPILKDIVSSPLGGTRYRITDGVVTVDYDFPPSARVLTRANSETPLPIDPCRLNDFRHVAERAAGIRGR